ncbi:SNARE complex subunit [Phaeosphaeriaceae sp. PMI808]|nr:SNARE complex subunit [Phaeosphaeriaceae sp. PMI808]
MATNPPQLFLLADHIKLSLLERQRAISLNISSNTQDGQISRSLEQLRAGIESLQSQVEDTSDDCPPSSTLQHPNNPSLTPDFTAAQKKPRQISKSVRFTDNPSSDDTGASDIDPNRAALFPYRDNPDPDAAPDHSNLDNQQIHEYHSQVIRDQDDQLDQLGASIGRQRELSMQIGDELDGQVMLLDDVEEGVDRHTAQFKRARGRLDRFSKKAKDNWSLSIIVALIIILVLLIVITK